MLGYEIYKSPPYWDSMEGSQEHSSSPQPLELTPSHYWVARSFPLVSQLFWVEKLCGKNIVEWSGG